MAWTTEQRDALQAAIASGVLSVRYGEKTITYQSLDAMRSVLSEMDRQLTPNAITHRFATVSKGC
jgi:hypothetical protein